MSDFFSGNSSFMRDINRSNILDLIRRMSPISQADLAKILKLQPSTILRIIKDLETDGLIYQSGRGNASPKGGRKASLWELNANGALAIGVDLGMGEIITVLVDLLGNIVGRVRKPCPSDQSSSEVMEVVVDTIRELLSLYGEHAQRVIGIGVGLPGRVDSKKGVSIYALNFNKWKNVPVGDILTQAFHLPVFIEGDMQLMALGEKWYGAGGDARNLLCIGLRRGIGLGVVVNGEIYRGKNQSAGDLGHVVVDPNGNLCHCGRRGCLEAVASETAILEWVSEYLKRNGINSFNGIIGSVQEVSMPKIYEALMDENFLVIDRVKESARYIGRVLSDLVRIFDPEKIIIGGGSVLSMSPIFLKMVRVTYEADQPNYVNESPEILPSKLAENSIALGAAVFILSQLFRIFDHASHRMGYVIEQ